MVSNTEGIIESFWDPELGYLKRWLWLSGPGSEVGRIKAWDRFNLNWTVDRGPAELVLERDYDLYVAEFESLILRAQFPPELKVALSAVIDGEERMVIMDRPGELLAGEYEGPIEGDWLQKIRIRFTTEVPGSKDLNFRWLMVRRDGVPWVGPTPDYDRLLAPNESQEFTPGLNLVLSEGELERLRAMTVRADRQEIWQAELNEIRTSTESIMDATVPRYSLYVPTRYGRSGEEPRREFDLALRAALAGLVARDDDLMRFAARQAIRLALIEFWKEGFVSHFRGSDWGHSAFAENQGTIRSALLLDFCWHWLSPDGRALIAQAIREKGLVNLQCSEAVANQGVRFHRGLLLGQLALSKAGLGKPMSRDEVFFSVASLNHLLDPLIRADGTFSEGPGYGLGTVMSTLLTYEVAARYLDVPVGDLAHPRILSAMRFVVEIERDIPSTAAAFCAGPLAAVEFNSWISPGPLTFFGERYANVPEMGTFGRHWLWADQQTVAEVNQNFPRYSLYPDGGWIFARDSGPSAAEFSFESGLWDGHGHSWLHKNSITFGAWGERLLLTRHHVSYADGRFQATYRTEAYNTFSPLGRNQDKDGPAGRGSHLHTARDLAWTTVVEADNATAWTESVERNRRRVLFVRPHVLLVEDHAKFSASEVAVQSWNSLKPFSQIDDRTSALITPDGTMRISRLTGIQPRMTITEDSVHRDSFNNLFLPVFRTAFSTAPKKEHYLATLITLSPKGEGTDQPRIHSEGLDGEYLEITQGSRITRISRSSAFHERLQGVETDGSFVFATYEGGNILESGSFDGSYLSIGTDRVEGSGFLAIVADPKGRP